MWFNHASIQYELPAYIFMAINFWISTILAISTIQLTVSIDWIHEKISTILAEKGPGVVSF